MLAVAKCVVFAHEIQPKTVTVSHSDLRSLDSATFPASTREASVESYIFPTQQQTVRKLRLRSNGKSNSLQLRRRRGPNHCHPPYTRPHISTARRLLLPFSARHALRSIHFDLPLSRCHVSCKSLPTRRTTQLLSFQLDFHADFNTKIRNAQFHSPFSHNYTIRHMPRTPIRQISLSRGRKTRERRFSQILLSCAAKEYPPQTQASP